MAAVTSWTPADMPDQAGRTALVTGASSGLGFEVALALAAAGASVLLGCRDPDRGRTAMARISGQTPGAGLRVLNVDLASLESVRTAAAELAQRHEVIDLLVNNAGVMATPHRRTDDGFELQLGVNHLGHFALTGLLLDRMADARRPRVVTVSSALHRRGRVDLSDLLWERRRYRPWAAYEQSKLANLLFTLQLARRAEAAGLALTAVAAHPGVAATDLTRDLAVARWPVMGPAVRAVVGRLGQGAAAGAMPLLYAATMPGVENGDYFGPGGTMELRGAPARVSRSARAADIGVAAALWEQSEELTGVRFPI